MKNFISAVCLASFFTVALHASETKKPTLEIPEGFKHVGFILSPTGNKPVVVNDSGNLCTRQEDGSFTKGLDRAEKFNYRADSSEAPKK